MCWNKRRRFPKQYNWLFKVHWRNKQVTQMVCGRKGAIHSSQMKIQRVRMPRKNIFNEVLGIKKICKNQQEVHLLDSELVELLKSLDPKEVLKTLCNHESASMTSRVMSCTFFCSSGVKYSFTRNATKWKQKLVHLNGEKSKTGCHQNLSGGILKLELGVHPSSWEVFWIFPPPHR